MSDDQTTGREEIAELRERVRRLEIQVAQLGQGRSVFLSPEEPAAEGIRPTRPCTEDTVATVFTRVAMLSFVLLGALILRTLTQQNILGTRFGTLLGFVYAGHLIGLSLLPGRPGRFARATSLFQCCGVLLSFFIALESALRAQTLARPTAMILIGGFTALALCVAMAHRKASLAGTALAGGMLALAALGLNAEGFPLQASLLWVFATVAALLSWRYAWRFLRPLTFPLLMILLPVGFLLEGGESPDHGTLYACATAFWLVLTLQHLLAFRKLSAAAVWLPLSTLWLAALIQLEAGPAFAYTAAGVSILATLVTGMATRAALPSSGGTTGMAATAVITAAIGWLMLDPGGVLCALAGWALWTTVRKSPPPRPPWAATAAVILMTAAAIRGGRHLVNSGASSYSLIAGLFLTAILLIHYLYTDRPRAGTSAGLARYLAPLVLVEGLLVLFAVLWSIAKRLLPELASFQLAETGILTAAAVLLTLYGHAGHRRAVLYSGLASMFASLVKVGLIDLNRLSGLRLLASIVLIGLSSIAVSVILRRRA